MRVLQVNEPDDGLEQGWRILKLEGVPEPSRAGDVIVYPTPVTTVWHSPINRVSIDPHRDANPFFHLYEALWMLRGENDATMLDKFVSDFSTRFAEKDGRQHGAYGWRWKMHFNFDQLAAAIDKLRDDPTTRQVVISMWDPDYDFSGNWKDRPCNTHIYFRRRTGNYLDMTVCCRSNDIFWGCYGANAVHFSILLEYMANRVGCWVGRYYQVSNNYHLYMNVQPKAEMVRASTQVLNKTTRIFTRTDHDYMYAIDKFLNCEFGSEELAFKWVLNPMFMAYDLRKSDPEKALSFLSPELHDWHHAAYHWIKRRMK